MDICKVLAGFNPISLSDFDLSERAISSGTLPDPSLFFTWYCEKARDIEKFTGSVEFGLNLLDLALGSLSSNSRIAKRFILATRHSLLRYNAHINSLASKLEQENLSAAEKVEILQTLRTIDLKTFEMSASKPQASTGPTDNLINEHEQSDENVMEIFETANWDFELEIFNLILEGHFDEAFNHAQHSVFFPSALIETNPIEWLQIYSKTIGQECEKYFESIKGTSVQILSPEQCEDSWTEIVNAYLGSGSDDLTKSSYMEEQTMCLLLTKSQMAQSILQSHLCAVELLEGEDATYF